MSEENKDLTVKEKPKKEYKLKKRSKYYKGWYRVIRVFFAFIINPFYPMTVLGLQNIPQEGAYIMAGNHRSAKDIFAIGLNTTQYKHFVSKEEHLKFAANRWVFQKVDAYTVKRGKADMAFMRNVLNALKAGEPICIFPEGTRNKSADEEMLELKNGTAMFAYKTGAAIVPFYIYKVSKMFRRNYMYIGEPFKLTDVAESGMLDRAKLDAGAKLIREKFDECMEYLGGIVENKTVKKVKKADNKELKCIRKQLKLRVKNAKAQQEGEVAPE